MKIRFHEKLYKGDLSDRKIASIKKKVKLKSKTLNIFFVTLPVSNHGILEIYWYPELLQKAYQALEDELVVVGVARTREDAFLLVKDIIEDVGADTKRIPVSDYFGENI